MEQEHAYVAGPVRLFSQPRQWPSILLRYNSFRRHTFINTSIECFKTLVRSDTGRWSSDPDPFVDTPLLPMTTRRT